LCQDLTKTIGKLNPSKMNKQVKLALKQLNFRWKAKHLNHIVENIVFKKRNISFLAINALFRQKSAKIEDSITFSLDRHYNIIVSTAYSENDD